MPWHYHPILRAREEAEESNGLIVSENSAGVTDILAAESAGTRLKVVPVAYTLYIRGSVYTAS